MIRWERIIYEIPEALLRGFCVLNDCVFLDTPGI